jgi:hypothetical protein
MRDIERFNLMWLCSAMTAPLDSNQLYYFDGLGKIFFSSKPSLNMKSDIELFDMVDLIILPPLSADIRERLAEIDLENSEIVEIPRLNVQDKVSVQLLFLSKFPGVIHEESLRLAAEKQEDVSGFVLDEVLRRIETLAPMEPYWEDFKLKTIQYYLEKFTGVIGITLRML